MASNGLTGQPLRSEGAFNWVYLVEEIVVGILTFAWIVARLIRLYTWHKFRLYIDIEALQISFLAGRVFFKGIRYHGINQTVLVHEGHITWRYWLRKVKECELFDEDNHPAEAPKAASLSGNHHRSRSESENRAEKGGVRVRKPLPCRIEVKVSGVEAFLYNRSPVYDEILATIQTNGSTDQNAGKQARDAQQKNGYNDSHHPKIISTTSSDIMLESKSAAKDRTKAADEKLAIEHTPQDVIRKALPPSMLRLLPIVLEVKKAAVVLGNENTKCIITAKIASATGEFDASPAGPLDPFKIVMNFNVSHPFVQMKPNIDYRRPQLVEAEAIKLAQNRQSVEEGDRQLDDSKSKGSRFLRHTNWMKFPGISIKSRRSLESINTNKRSAHLQGKLSYVRSDLPGQRAWLGLRRYLEDDQQNEHDEWDAVEYAKSSTLADITSLSLCFYWDIPGLVPWHPIGNDAACQSRTNDINGDDPPDYGVDLVIHGGQINYGPWADRHRIVLQQVFFPAPFADAHSSPLLRPGQTRINTAFKLFVSIEGDTTVRIPFREPSKDAKWKGRATAVTDQRRHAVRHDKSRSRSRKRVFKHSRRDKGTHLADVRPFAWFDIKVGADSTITYVMDMVAGKDGYQNKLKVDVARVDIFSSLNHSLLWRSQRIQMNCDLSNPLAWNGLRSWPFDIGITRLDLFLLRDHTFLLVDLIEDWSAGPLPSFLTFVPFRYLLKIHFVDFKLFLNINDANIVNNSDDLDNNDFVILYGRTLTSDLVIPLDRFRPTWNDINFEILSHDLGFELCLPASNTLNTLLVHKDVAQLRSVHLLGVYTYLSDVSPGQTETMNMDVVGTGLNISLYGFFIRQLVKIKENYFGDDIHFTTLEEYQELLKNNFTGKDNNHPLNKSNDLDVILNIVAEDSTLILPAGMYNDEEHIHIKVHNVDVDLRVLNYYLELMVDSSPLEIGCTVRTFEQGSTQLVSSNTEVFVEAVRVYGHRLFGLPPAEPPYISNWDIDGGSITGECSSNFIAKIMEAAQGIALTIDDKENALPIVHSSTIHDTTFVRFKCPSIRIWCHVDQIAFLLSIQDLHGSFNDWANTIFSQRLHLQITDLSLSCVDGEAAHQKPNDEGFITETYAYLKTAIAFTMVQRSKRYQHQQRSQQEHMRINDRPSRRACFFTDKENSISGKYEMDSADVNVISVPLPALPKALSLSRDQSLNEQLASAEAHALYDLQKGVAQAQINSPSYSPGSKAHSNPSGPFVPESLTPRIGMTSARHTLLQNGRNCHSEATRGSWPPTMAFSSPYRMPHFPLNPLQPNEAELPDVPTMPSMPEGSSRRSFSPDISRPNRDFDDDNVHTSLIISINQGVVAYCMPVALHAVADLLQRISPRLPETILDYFHSLTIREVLESYARKHGRSSVMDLSVRVPYIGVRFINTFPSNLDHTKDISSDRYNLALEDVIVNHRTKTVSNGKQELDSVSMHATIKSVSLSVKEGSVGSKEDLVAFQAVIDDVLLWSINNEQTTVHASFQVAEARLASSEVDYLASLIHRTTLLVEKLHDDFAMISKRKARRLRTFAYCITKLGEDMPDPSFLTRPSYVLRSANQHLRNSDSWKIISRFRYCYQCLSHDDRVRVVTDCLNDSYQLPEEAELYVLQTLDNWRSWDTIQVAASLAMRVLYGCTIGNENILDRSRKLLGAIIQASSLKLLVDPGTRQNEFLMTTLDIVLQIVPRTNVARSPFTIDQRTGMSLVMQIRTGEIKLHLNWEVCHLVDELLTLFEQSAPGHQQVNKQHPMNSEDDGSDIHQFHVVFAADSGSICLETINLKHVVLCDYLNGSILGTGVGSEHREPSVNILVAAATASAEMQSHEKALWTFCITKPSLWVFYERFSAASDATASLELAANGSELWFESKEELIGLIEVFNNVIQEEVAHIRHLVETHPITPRTSNEIHPNTTSKTVKIDLALFLDVYNIKLLFIQDITYSTTGRVARVSVSPNGAMGSNLQIDYDLKGQVHEVISTTEHRQACVSRLQIPPINSTIQVFYTSHTITATATATIEQIVFDGAAVYGLLTILGSLEVESAINAIQHDVLAAMQSFRGVFPQKKPSQVEKAFKRRRNFVYDGNIALAGFSISVDVPAKSHHKSRTYFLFDLTSTQLRAANRSSRGDDPLPFPEFRFAIEHMEIEMQRSYHDRSQPCGRLSFGALFTCTLESLNNHMWKRSFKLTATGPKAQFYSETAPAVVEILGHLRGRIKSLNIPRKKNYLSRLGGLRTPAVAEDMSFQALTGNSDSWAAEYVSALSFEVQSIQISYVVGNLITKPISSSSEDLVLTIKSISLLTRSASKARLRIEAIQLQMVALSQLQDERSSNSALLPEAIFNVAYRSTSTDRSIIIHAAGKALDLHLDPHFIIPANAIAHSIAESIHKFRAATASVQITGNLGNGAVQNLFGERKFSSMLVDADFAGAVVRLEGKQRESGRKSTMAALHTNRIPQHGRYGQFASDDAVTTATLQAPGIALKLRYKNKRSEKASLNVEVKVQSSNNILHPAVVPLIIQLSDSVKEAVGNSSPKSNQKTEDIGQKPEEKGTDEESLVQADPRAILGRTELNVGFRICKQEFSLSCQPIAKVAATAKIEDLYVTLNTVNSEQNGNFFAVTAQLIGFDANLQHVYSRDTTFAFGIDSIVLSLMNNKHISGKNGISAILKIDPTRMQINAKQMQDILLFREIWLPPEIRHASKTAASAAASSSNEPQEYFAHRYQQVAAATPFPWNATVAVVDLSIDLDFGQSIGKTSLRVSHLWASSKKTMTSQSDLCVGVNAIEMTATGRMSGFIELEKFKVRTSIAWPQANGRAEKTPLIQGSVAFDQLRVKAAYDYQAFTVAHITAFEFLMYNVRNRQRFRGDRLVAILDGDKAKVYCLAASAAYGLSLFQAFERLVQEKETSYQQALRDIEKFMRRKSSVFPARGASKLPSALYQETDEGDKLPISLHTDVVLTLRSMDIGAFPSTLLDHQILKMEANDIQIRFAVTLDDKKIHSGLGLTLGQLKVALASVSHSGVPKTLGEITIEDVLSNATLARGGTIVRVPRVVAAMQTWQAGNSKVIDYIFSSSFEGKIDVGWNYSRISFIRSMWATHARNLAARLGKPLPEPALKISGVPHPPVVTKLDDQVLGADVHSGGKPTKEVEQHKITAAVSLPQSKYIYRALEPPIIDTPQLRDMGEATPPLEWVGLHRDRLPHVTHQIIIVTLLEIVKEVEDAYSHILGSA